DAEFHFKLDAAALPSNALCRKFFTPDDDALAQDWGSQAVWLNPPFTGGKPGAWVQKASEEAHKGATVVCLLPQWTSWRWWHQIVTKYAAEIGFLTRRPIRFRNGHGELVKESIFTLCCVVIFRPGSWGPPVIGSIAVPTKDGTRAGPTVG